jgi:hypothetical protein
MRLTDVGAAITAAGLTLASNEIAFTLGCGITVTPELARAQVEGEPPGDGAGRRASNRPFGLMILCSERMVVPAEVSMCGR